MGVMIDELTWGTVGRNKCRDKGNVRKMGQVDIYVFRKEFMTMYSDIVQRCFTDCANDFTSKALSSKEVGKGGIISIPIFLTFFMILRKNVLVDVRISL